MRCAAILISAPLLLAPASVSANELMKAYELALKNDPTYLAAQHIRDAAVWARPLARAVLLPQIVGAYSLSDQHSEYEPVDKSLCPPAPASCTDVRDSEPYSLTLSLQQTIFDWAAFQTFSQAGDTSALAAVSFRAAQQNLILRSAQAYFAVLTAADALRASRAENKALERQLEQARRRFEVGLSAITDVQEAQARYDLTVATVIDAERSYRSSREALAEITGSSAISLSSVTENLTLASPDPQNLARWTEVAVAENLDMAASKLQTSIANKNIGIARGGYLPTVNVQASKGKGELDQGNFTAEYDQERYTLNVNVPLFSGLAVWSAISQAQSVLEQRRAEELGARRRIERTTHDAYQNVIAGGSRVKALKQAVLSNKTALEASEVGLQVGARTNVDVLNAQQLLYSAQRDYSTARYNYLVSILTLKASAGRLIEKDLAEIDSLLTTCPAASSPVEPGQDSICSVGSGY
jgi:outer membrane protein